MRLAKQPQVKEAYDKFLKEYLELEHMELIPIPEIDRISVYQHCFDYFLYHVVFHSSKIRVVFNASMPAYNDKFLNSFMHTSTKLQQDIVKVLCRCRCYCIVFTSDIVRLHAI